MATNKETANQLFEKHHIRNRWKPNYLNLASSVLLSGCAYGIIAGSGLTLPLYSWVCVAILIGYLNPYPLGRLG